MSRVIAAVFATTLVAAAAIPTAASTGGDGLMYCFAAN